MSGGADSLALLSLACRSGCEATAVFVDHGLRAEAAKEAVVVERACGVLGAAFRRVEVKVEEGRALLQVARPIVDPMATVIVVEVEGDYHRVLTSPMLGDDGEWHEFMRADHRRRKQRPAGRLGTEGACSRLRR